MTLENDIYKILLKHVKLFKGTINNNNDMLVKKEEFCYSITLDIMKHLTKIRNNWFYWDNQ